MSHHRKLFITIEGTQIEVGHARVTNEGEILSIWIDHGLTRTLFLPEGGN